MPDDPLQQVLRLVAEGRLTAEEAAPILDALEARQEQRDRSSAEAGAAQARFARIEVVESGRKAVDLRVPLVLGRRALSAIPGLSSAQAAEISEAVTRGLTGRIVDIEDDDGSGVRIVLE